MTRRRFRWTRDSYLMAHHLSRLLARFSELPFHQPYLLRRYWELWEQYPPEEDPLLTPVSQRLQWVRDSNNDGIPF
jgi:hypothetical protein